MPEKKKIKRSDLEEKAYYKGLVRKKDKRIKSLEKEVSRLSKYLMRDDWDYEWDEDESKLTAPKKEKVWSCVKCETSEYHELIVPQKDSFRRYTTCKNCGNRTKVIIDGKIVDAGG